MLSPECVATIGNLPRASTGSTARRSTRAQSFVEIGAAQFDERSPSPTTRCRPTSVGLAFDTEGTPKRARPGARRDHQGGWSMTAGAPARRAPSRPATPSPTASVGPVHGDLVVAGGGDAVDRHDRRGRPGPVRGHLQLLPDPRPEEPGGHRPHPQRHLHDRERCDHRGGDQPAVHPVLRRRARRRAGCSTSATTSATPTPSSARDWCGRRRCTSPPGTSPEGRRGRHVLPLRGGPRAKRGGGGSRARHAALVRIRSCGL